MGIIHLSLLVILCVGVHRSSAEILRRQKRNWIIDSFTIDEGYTGTYPYLLGKVDIEKNFTFFKIHGQGVDKDPRNILRIDENTGEVHALGPVDYEKYSALKLTFQAIDRQRHVIDTQLGIEVKIMDSNDNAPKFDLAHYVVTIKELTLQGTELTTFRASDDDSTEAYRTFDFRIVSVTPKPHDLTFYITENKHAQTGSLFFKGCLDHERADKYTVIVEAKDKGENPLSSSCTITVNIEDGNNHLPVITKQTGPGRVKEGQENVLVSRLHVTDEDSKGTAAWRAKYEIQGDPKKHFRITTDPETNDGLLYVEKYLDYEESALRNLTITVENEIPYFSCVVKERSVSGLWKVVTTGGFSQSGTTVVTGTQQTSFHSTRQVTVAVEDVNEAPVFHTANKNVKLSENTEAGHYLETFTAKDPDVGGGSTFVYVKGEDRANWVTVDSKTGKVTTTKSLDRESVFVKNNTYKVTVYAVDNGQPKMTGTATLSIQISDENDNAPYLVTNIIDVCQSSEASRANITAVDLDEQPFSGPFRFELHGDVKGKWRVDPTYGYSVNLVRENTVHSGHYNLMLEVFDLQEKSAVHNLSVTVCRCSDPTKPNCHIRKGPEAKLGGAAVGVIFFSMLLLAGLILSALLMTCKTEKIPIPDDGSGQHLMTSNTETPGTDCTVALEPLGSGQNVKQSQSTAQVNSAAMKSSGYDLRSTVTEYGMSQSEMLLKQQKRENLQWLVTESDYMESQGKSKMAQTFSHLNAVRRSMGAASAMRMRHQLQTSQQWSSMERDRQYLETMLLRKLQTLQAAGQELGDYDPHVYAEEGGEEHNFALDAIAIPEVSFDPNLDLDTRFSSLASVCMPSVTTAYSTKTSTKTHTQVTSRTAKISHL